MRRYIISEAVKFINIIRLRQKSINNIIPIETKKFSKVVEKRREELIKNIPKPE